MRRCLAGAHFPYDFGQRKKRRVSASLERYSASLSGDRRCGETRNTGLPLAAERKKTNEFHAPMVSADMYDAYDTSQFYR